MTKRLPHKQIIPGLIGRVIKSITQQAYLNDVLLENYKTTCFGQHWPSSGFHPKTFYAVRVLYEVCSGVSMLRSDHRGF